MTSSEHIVTPLVKPQTAGIIWLTNNSLELETLGVYEINYLLNGLLIQSLESGLSNPDKNLYLSENFGNAFFIAHIKLDPKNELNAIYSHLEMVKDQLTENLEVLFLCEEKNENVVKIFEKIEKKFSHLHFHLKSLID